MLRRFVGILLFELCTIYCGQAASSIKAQPEAAAESQPQCTSVHACVLKIREAEASHTPAASVGRLYQALGNAEHSAGNLPNAETAMERAAKLLGNGPPDALAEVLSQLAVLHVEAGNLRSSEKELNQVSKIWEKAGDRLGLALTWNDLAGINLTRGHFDEALRFATQASAVLEDNASVSLRDRIAVRQTLGNALCGMGRYEEAIPVLSQASQLAETQVGETSVDAGVAKFLVGSAYWRAGDMHQASTWMADGIATLKSSKAWGRAPYLHAMTEYVQFLRARGDTDAAQAAERDIRAANSVVSVAALTEH